MIADIIADCLTHARPFIAGVVIGGALFGGSLGIIGWCLGYDHAMRKVGEWMRPKNRDPEHYGEMPTVPALPPERPRRFVGGDASWGGR